MSDSHVLVSMKRERRPSDTMSLLLLSYYQYNGLFTVSGHMARCICILFADGLSVIEAS